LAEITVLDCKDKDGNLEEELRLRNMELLSELRCINERELAIVIQKSRVNWLEKGNTNYRYFHSRLRWRRNRNELVGLDIDGVWVEEPQAVKEKVKNYMERRFVAIKQGEGLILKGFSLWLFLKLIVYNIVKV